MKHDLITHKSLASDTQRPLSRSIALLLVLSSGAFSLACNGSAKSVAEAPPSAPIATEERSPQITTKSAPELDNVQEAVRRVFKDGAMIETSRTPAFVTGDFNGDRSEDIAVVLKPSEENLAALNEEFPSWILRDLAGAQSGGSPRLRIARDEALLAVIHGYGPAGWRDPQATQTYLLKNAAGSAMERHSPKEFAAPSQRRKMPGLRGDVLGEVLNGKAGFLYFSNSSYAWYDPKTFTGEPAPRRGHGTR